MELQTGVIIFAITYYTEENRLMLQKKALRLSPEGTFYLQ
ncbi:MAG: hypothetical protein GQF41_3597 [Candidatus Rifleibacterium amylolyticum]|nr:MAG: hypothetical protein GQF41_3597 [Candidatus Rifleibacterium amylolyticum]